MGRDVQATISTVPPCASGEGCSPDAYFSARYLPLESADSIKSPITFLKFTLVEVFVLKNSKLLRMKTYQKLRAHFAQFSCNVSPFRMNTYEKHGGRGGVIRRISIPPAPILSGSDR